VFFLEKTGWSSSAHRKVKRRKRYWKPGFNRSRNAGAADGDDPPGKQPCRIGRGFSKRYSRSGSGEKMHVMGGDEKMVKAKGAKKNKKKKREGKEQE